MRRQPISTPGNFQTKTYELSECWWICRGSYGGQYSWQRYDDYTNAVINEYSTNYQNSKATTAEAQAGTNDDHWMTPLKVQQFLTNRLASQAEAEAGTNNNHWMTPKMVKIAIDKFAPLNQDILSDQTRELLLLDSSSTPDSAFQKLALGVGKYGYKITVKTPKGHPVSGITVTGVTTITGGA